MARQARSCAPADAELRSAVACLYVAGRGSGAGEDAGAEGEERRERASEREADRQTHAKEGRGERVRRQAAEAWLGAAAMDVGDTRTIRASRGRPHPLGASIASCDRAQDLVRVNFAVHTRATGTVYVCVFPPLPLAGDGSACVVRDMLVEEPLRFGRGDVRHVELGPISSECAYAYRIDGIPRLLSDVRGRFAEARPAAMWAKYDGESISSNGSDTVRGFLSKFPSLAKRVHYPFQLSRIVAEEQARGFDWGDDAPPNLPVESLVVYEAHVRGMTAQMDDRVCPGGVRGTFLALLARLPHLRALGVTAVQLLPISEFNEIECGVIDELTALRPCADGRRINFWGYAPVQPAAFTPMARYGRTPVSAGAELKALVKALHAAGMECYLDLVYNHVAGPSCSLHFFDVKHDYFIPGGEDAGAHSNVSGCGNTLAPDAPAMTELVLESLRWWVSEYHVDGFRLDAGGVFARDRLGKPSRHTRVLEAITDDAMLKNVKLIVEPWDAGDGIGQPNFLNGKYPHGDRFMEWNPDYMRAVRRFIRGDLGASQEFREALRGFPKHFHDRSLGACHSVNYIACHDGFCLADIVSYTRRTNEDGYDEPTTTNCGMEGPCTRPDVVELREKQMRNFLLTLALSRGVPMILQGDEVGVSKLGNNNSYDVDDGINYLPRPQDMTRKSGLLEFARGAFALRRHFMALRGRDFFDAEALCFCWHRRDGAVWWPDGHGLMNGGHSADWNGGYACGEGADGARSKEETEAEDDETEEQFVAFTVGNGQEHTWLYVAFNTAPRPARIRLPYRPLEPEDCGWTCICNTATALVCLPADKRGQRIGRDLVVDANAAVVCYWDRFAHGR